MDKPIRPSSPLAPVDFPRPQGSFFVSYSLQLWGGTHTVPQSN